MKIFARAAALCVVVTFCCYSAAAGESTSSTRLQITSEMTSAPLGLHVRSDGRLTLHGQPYRGIGVNYFNAFYRSLDGTNDTWRAGLRYLHNHDVPFIRFMCGAYWPNQWKLYRENKAAYFARMDAFVNAAEEAGIGLIPSLFWQINTMPDIAWEPINKWGDRESSTIKFMKTYTQEVVRRYKDSPAIWAWEFGNEMNLEVDLPHHKPQVSVENGTPFMRTPYDRISTDDMKLAFTEFAKAVREIDPDRMIVSGNANARPSAWHLMSEKSWKKDSRAQYVTMLGLQNPDPIDSISVHVYPDQDSAYEFSHETSTSLAMVVKTAQDASLALKKPLFVGEFGAPRGSDPEAEHAMFDKMLQAITTNAVPLAAVWVFDYSPQDKDWNIAPGGDREYQIKAIGALNREYKAARSR